MSITRKIYFDWSKSGVWVDMSDYVLSISGSIGRTDWKTRVANVGIVTMELKNTDRRFSPEFTASPYYGQLLPNIPVKVEVTDSTGTHRVLTLWTADWDPHPDQYAQDLRCTLTCVDRMAKLQDADISLPIQTSTTAGALLRKITSEVYQSGVAEAAIYCRMVENNDTITIGAQTYTFKSALTPADNEVALGTQNWGFAAFGVSDAAYNVAAAINRDVRSGTDYAAGTARHVSVTAIAQMGIGLNESDASGSKNLLDASAQNYEKLATSFVFGATPTIPELANEPMTLTVRRVWLYLKKTGSPTGTLTLRLETPGVASDYFPSGVLYHTSAVATVLESSLSTSWGWVAFDFSEDIEIDAWPEGATINYHWLVLSSNRAASLINYVSWSTTTVGHAGRYTYTYMPAGGAWAAKTFNQGFLCFVGGRLDLKANAHGAWGNVALAQTGDNIVLSGAALTGGIDGPVGAFVYDAGVLTLDYAGDTWVSGETSALTAIDDTVRSEFGLFWAARNGDLTFKDQHYQFALANTTPAMTCSDDHTGQVGKLSKDNVINRATVSYQPRSLLASTVIAKAKQPIKVLGKAGTRPVARWNPTQLKTRQAGEKIQVVPYVDAGTAEQVGAVNIVQPLTPTTDYTVYDTEDKSGFNYTTEDYVQFAFALVGSGIQVQVTNSATGPVWIHDLQISGSALSKQDTQQFTTEDATSRTAYGLKTQDYSIPFPSDDVDTFAEMLATFWVNAYKDPRYRIESISFYGVETVGGVSVFDLEIGDLILLSENQTYAQNFKLMILGLGIELPETGLHTITASVQRLEYDSYWQIETAGHSTLGVNTRLAL